MFRLLVRIFAVIGLAAVAGLAFVATLLYGVVFGETSLPKTIVLDLDLTRPLVEQVAESSVSAALFGGDLSLRDVVDALDRGAGDPRVKGVVARLGGDAPGLALAEELRAALGRFRAAGRFAFAFADSLGEFGPGNAAVYLASAFDKVWLQPGGLVGLTGLAAEVPFARDALDRLKVEPELEHRREFKSAVESLTERGFTAAHREMMESLLDDLSQQLVDGTAEGRKLTPEAVRALIDRGPLLADEAIKAGLVDALGYWDEVEDAATTRAGGDAETVEVADYLDAAGSPHDSGPTIAVVFGVGAIQSGKSQPNPVTGSGALGADDVVEAFNQAIDDDDVRAILFRIDSPGGSVTGSETIRRAVVRAKAAGKPVVVSMGSAAASGGYWVAMNADRIVALPATQTGSIGVFAGKIATAGLWHELGINFEGITRGRNAAMWSLVEPYQPAAKLRLNAILDDLYGTFTRNVAEARKLTPERVEEIARGRVWTGRQAKDLGLVDDLGDFEEALNQARIVAKLAPDAPVTLTVFPRPRPTLERLADLLSGLGQARDDGSARAALAALQPLLSRLVPLAVGSDQALRMPDTGLQGVR
ncbi:MAG: signal peptide peptidase SppA [Azospirillum sp.]|nr:signal peptide peptidase SppA [Azospirillum sp.]